MWTGGAPHQFYICTQRYLGTCLGFIRTVTENPKAYNFILLFQYPTHYQIIHTRYIDSLDIVILFSNLNSIVIHYTESTV